MARSLKNAEKQQLSSLLFSNTDKENSLKTFAIIDAARESSIPFFLDGLKANYQNLLKDDDLKGLEKAAPYLVELNSNSGTDKWFVEKLYGDSVGFAFKSNYSLGELGNFWSRKVRQESANTKESGYFRFYDPRVLRDYLSILDAEDETKNFLEVIDTLIVESMDATESIVYKRNDEDSFGRTVVELNNTEDKVA
jgi:hypothetical protein